MTSKSGRTRVAGRSSNVREKIAAGACAGLAATLMLSCAPAALHAEPSLSELAAEIQALKADNQRMKAENREMKAAIANIHGETKRTAAKVRAVAERGPAPVPAAGAFPPGVVPTFVTVDNKLHFGAITITPGGFLAGESVFRTRTTNSDINSAWGAIPLGNNPLSRLNEYRLTGRQSRLALLAEGAITPTMIAQGYAEFDFLGAGTTSNATDTNSYAPRIRSLYAGLDNTEYGLHFLAGQMWSLSTLNSKGITPRNEVLPSVIDGQFLPGTIFARQAAVRLTKDFGRKLWVSIAAEEAQTTFSTAACSGAALSGTTNGAGEGTSASPVVTGVGTLSAVCAATASGAGFSQYGQPYSLNHVPDVIGKVAYEATLGDRDIHLEAMGLYKDLYDASFPTGTLGTLSVHDVAGYGGGGGLIVPVIPKRLDFEAQALAGRGIGRYGAGLLPDATFNPDGSLRPIGEVIGLAGVTLHATPALDLYAFGGVEHENPAFGTSNSGTTIGYGAPTASNFGCNILNAPNTTALPTCSGQTQTLWQVTGGFWDKLYKGSFGEVRVGAQYSYTQRDVFGTQNTAVPAAAAGAAGLTVAQAEGFFRPKAEEHTIMTSIRYYPFQVDPAPPVPVVAKY